MGMQNAQEGGEVTNGAEGNLVTPIYKGKNGGENGCVDLNRPPCERI